MIFLNRISSKISVTPVKCRFPFFIRADYYPTSSYHFPKRHQQKILPNGFTSMKTTKIFFAFGINQRNTCHFLRNFTAWFLLTSVFSEKTNILHLFIKRSVYNFWERAKAKISATKFVFQDWTRRHSCQIFWWKWRRRYSDCGKNPARFKA